MLAYHGIADVRPRDDPYGLFIRPRDLRDHIRRLRNWGYRLMTFGELAGRVGAGEASGCAALTFDDGLADNLETMLPLVRSEGATATVFVVSDWLGKHHPEHPAAAILAEEGVRELHGAGVEIGSHTVRHADLTALSYNDARRELADSRRSLESVIDAPVTVAAYPWGLANDDTRRACAAAGYAAACRNAGEGAWDDPFDIPRQDVRSDDVKLSLWLKRDDRYEPLMRRTAARAARRLVREARRLTR